jgi:hypothetical protein
MENAKLTVEIKKVFAVIDRRRGCVSVVFDNEDSAKAYIASGSLAVDHQEYVAQRWGFVREDNAVVLVDPWHPDAFDLQSKWP